MAVEFTTEWAREVILHCLEIGMTNGDYRLEEVLPLLKRIDDLHFEQPAKVAFPKVSVRNDEQGVLSTLQDLEFEDYPPPYYPEPGSHPWPEPLKKHFFQSDESHAS